MNLSKGKVAALLIVLTLLASGCGHLPEPYVSQYKNRDNRPDADNNAGGTLKFRFIDVGQGDATLITTPNGKNILIDAGTAEMGRDRVLPLLSNSDLELIIASHFDADHIGGIPEVIKGIDGIPNTDDDIIPTIGVLDRGRSDSIDTPELSNYFILTPDYRYSLNPGDKFKIDDVTFSVLAQNGEFSDGHIEDIDPENENAHSISMLISFGDINYLTSGDLPGPNFENRYEPYDLEAHLPTLIDHVDILHVSHHGSHNSTNIKFVEALRPKIAIISVGDNDYGHPHPVAIENLLESGAEIYSTKTDGDICMEAVGSNIRPCS